MKKIRVGMIGYGFMSRLLQMLLDKHPNFPDLPYEPELNILCKK